MTINGTSREDFDKKIQALFDLNNPDSQALFGFIQRLLYQFRISKTYEAKDIIVEAYARGIRLIESGTTIAKPLAWTRSTSYNIIREYRREMDKVQDKDLDQEPYLGEVDALSQQILREDLQTLRIALRRLEPEEREILRLRIVNNMSWREVGQCLVLTEDVAHSENTIRQRGFRALKRLREIFEEERENLSVSWDDADPS